MNPEQKTKFRKLGYYTAPIDVTDEEISAAYAYCTKLPYETIFKDVGGGQDPDRFQARLDRCTATEPVYLAVEFVLNQADERYEIREAVALKSLPGGAIQGVHRDMSLSTVRSDIAANEAPPLGVMVALMADTRLRVFNGCFGDTVEVDMGKAKDVPVEVRQCLVFRGDLAHCGLSYSQFNIRIHFAVGIAGSGALRNETHPVVLKSHDCKCGSAFSTKKSLTKHLSWCKQFGDPDRVEATRKRYKELNEAQTTCAVCQKVYPTKSAARQHMQKHTMLLDFGSDFD